MGFIYMVTNAASYFHLLNNLKLNVFVLLSFLLNAGLHEVFFDSVIPSLHRKSNGPHRNPDPQPLVNGETSIIGDTLVSRTGSSQGVF